MPLSWFSCRVLICIGEMQPQSRQTGIDSGLSCLLYLLSLTVGLLQRAHFLVSVLFTQHALSRYITADSRRI